MTTGVSIDAESHGPVIWGLILLWQRYCCSDLEDNEVLSYLPYLLEGKGIRISTNVSTRRAHGYQALVLLLYLDVYREWDWDLA